MLKLQAENADFTPLPSIPDAHVLQQQQQQQQPQQQQQHAAAWVPEKGFGAAGRRSPLPYYSSPALPALVFKHCSLASLAAFPLGGSPYLTLHTPPCRSKEVPLARGPASLLHIRKFFR